jgi:glucose-1-phosphate thymidylyltransferase
MARHGVLLVSTPPAAGRQPLQTPIPALQPVANRPIVCHALQALRDAAVDEISVAVPAAVAEDVQACVGNEFPGLNVHYVKFAEQRHAGAALRLAAEHMDNAPCLVHVADGLLAQPLSPLTQSMDDGSIDMLLLVHRCAQHAEQLDEDARRLLGLAEFPPASSTLGVAGVCAFGLGALRRACAGAQFAGGKSDFIAMADGLATAGGRMAAELVHGWRRYGGHLNDLLDLNRATLGLLVTDHEYHRDDGTNRIEGTVSIDPTAIVTSSVIVGPVIIGPGACISHAYVGPYTSIGADARIEGAEVEQSIIAAEASVRHIGGRLSSSVIGPRARIHRDFSVPRALRLRVGQDVEVSLP